MANKFKGRWRSEIKVNGVWQNETPHTIFKVNDGTSSDKIKVKKPENDTDENDGTTTATTMTFKSVRNNRRYSGTITSENGEDMVVEGHFENLQESLEATQKEQDSQTAFIDDEWRATRPPN